MNARPLILLCFSLCVSPVFAQVESEPEVDRLRRENAELRARVALLEAELASMREQLAAATTQPAGDGAAARGVDEQGVKTYRSADEILADLPTELRAKRNTRWDQYDASAVERWLRSVPVGDRFQADRIVENVILRPISKGGYRPTERPDQWRVTVTVRNTPIRYQSLGLIENISALTYEVDQDTLEMAKRLKPGDSVRLDATIRSIYFRGTDNLMVALSHGTLTSRVVKLGTDPDAIAPPEEEADADAAIE